MYAATAQLDNKVIPMTTTDKAPKKAKVSTIANSKAFNDKLAGIVKTSNNLGSNVQQLLDFALAQAATASPNLTPLGDLQVKLKSCKAVNSNRLNAYIVAHVENTTWVKSGDKKTLKQTKGKKVAVTIPSVSWLDFDSANKPASVASKLGGITPEKAKEAQAKFAERVKATDSLDVLRANAKQLEAQLATVNARLAKLAPKVVAA